MSRHVTSRRAAQVAYDATNDELYILDTAALACRLYKYRVAADEMLAAGVVLTSFTCSSVAVSATGSECFCSALSLAAGRRRCAFPWPTALPAGRGSGCEANSRRPWLCGGACAAAGDVFVTLSDAHVLIQLPSALNTYSVLAGVLYSPGTANGPALIAQVHSQPGALCVHLASTERATAHVMQEGAL